MARHLGFLFFGAALLSLILAWYFSGIRYGEFDAVSIPDFSKLKVDKVSSSEIRKVTRLTAEAKELSFTHDSEGDGYLDLFKKPVQAVVSGGSSSTSDYEYEDPIPDYVVSLIYYSKGSSKVVIDGKMYAEGALLPDESKITYIAKNSVNVRVGGGVKTLYVSDDKGKPDMEIFESFKSKTIN
jgi:hypothetical protein